MKRSDICFIRAKMKDDYVFDGIKNCGFKIMIPYKDRNLLLRCMREAWFRLRIPKRVYWYNKKIARTEAKVYIIMDPLITPDLLEWIKEVHPESRMIFIYENRADKTVKPDETGDFLEKWSYDQEDCQEYNMNLQHAAYFDRYRFQPEDKKTSFYDIVYLGRDKGRLKEILKIEKGFKSMGYRTYFHICADRMFLKYKNPHYKSLMSYSKYMELLKRSKAALNVVCEGQSSVTQRELETVFCEVKCITTNKAIKDFELYHPSRYFILGEDRIENLPEFMESSYVPVPEEKLKEYKFENVIREMLKRGK